MTIMSSSNGSHSVAELRLARKERTRTVTYGGSWLES